MSARNVAQSVPAVGPAGVPPDACMERGRRENLPKAESGRGQDARLPHSQDGCATMRPLDSACLFEFIFGPPSNHALLPARELSSVFSPGLLV